MREFETGATRDTDEDKLDYEGYFSPLVLERFAQYMQKNQTQSDGKQRTSDNWQKGIPKAAYMKSAWRHFIEWWKLYRRPPYVPPELELDSPLVLPELDQMESLHRLQLEEALCALLFNVQGYLHELLKGE